MPTVRCRRCLERHGVDPSLCDARHELCHCVRIAVSGAHADIARRAWGSLTGSRTPGALGRVPAGDVFTRSAGVWRRWGFRLGERGGGRSMIPIAATCVGSVYAHAVSLALGGALRISVDLLPSRSPRIKGGSREGVVARGMVAGVPPGWKVGPQMALFGYQLSACCSMWPWTGATLRYAWATFWAKCGRRATQGSSPEECLRLLELCVQPVVSHRPGRWRLAVYATNDVPVPREF